MKIFFTGSRGGFKDFGENYKAIKKILEKNGHTVFGDIIEIASGISTLESFEKRYKKIHQWIKLSDVIIAEISTPSTGVGYEIFFGLNEKKPVLVLIDEKIDTDQAATLRGNPSKLINIQKYNKNNIEYIIKNYLENVKVLLDKKFILIIPPEIDRYLEWAAKEKRMHKAQLVRDAIEDLMNKDKEYKKFLTGK